jgi:NADPH:quinone reductase-like Zn-dependent oxidoreductase
MRITIACSFNPIDYKRRNGDMKSIAPERAWPVVTGYDAAGVISEVGEVRKK